MFDPEEFRAESRECWETHAAGWASAAAEPFYAATMPIARWMVDHLEPQPGQTILELAAGRGDVGLLAAELVQPGGRTIITDGAEAMVELARKRGEALGVQGVEYRPMELEWLDEKAASIDGILSRLGYMLVPDPEAAMREARRVLKPGGRLVLSVWGPREANPWHTAATDAAVQLGYAPPPDPSQQATPGPFALSAEGLVHDLLEAAGFDVLAVEPIELTFEARSLDAFWETQHQMSPSMRTLLAGLAPADHYKMRDAIEERWQAYAREDGSVAIPGRALGAVAEA